jgi:DNA modification methylase
MLFYKIIIGDSRWMRELKDESIDFIVTSPPYWLRATYTTKESDVLEGDISRIKDRKTFFKELERVWRECFRVLKKSRYMAVNFQDVPYGSQMVGFPRQYCVAGDYNKSIENAGFYLISQWIWKKYKVGAASTKAKYTSYYNISKTHPRAFMNWEYVFCHAPGTKILMGDLSWKNIEDITIGEKVMGVENGKLVKTTVLNTITRAAECLEIKTEDTNLICSKDHRWLVRYIYKGKVSAKHYRKAIDIIPNKFALLYLSKPVLREDESEDYKRGYIIGVAIGDGSFWEPKDQPNTRCFDLLMRDYNRPILDRFKRFCDDLGIKVEWKKEEWKDGKPYCKLGTYTKSEVDKIDSCWSNSKEWMRGFLAGIFDSEGHISHQLIISNRNPEIVDVILTSLEKLGFKYYLRQQGDDYKVEIPRTQILEFYNTALPVKGLDKWLSLKKRFFHTKEVLSIKDAGLRKVYNITTGTGNYIAEGYISANCYVKPGPFRSRVLDFTMEEWDEWQDGVWYIQASSEKEFGEYATEAAIFPVELPRRLIKIYSNPRDVVLDPFLGSGTTMLAAKMLKRSCVGYEIRPELLDLIKKKVGYGEQSLDEEVKWEVIIRGKTIL